MKQLIAKISFVVLAAGFLMPVGVQAQDEKDKDVKVKDKEKGEQIIITRKNAKDEKVVITIDGDKVLVNGQPVKDDDDVKVLRHKIGDTWVFGDGMAGNWSDNFSLFNGSENRALLGVTTEINAKGAQIQTITKGGGAEKAGLQKNDIITKIDDKKIETPDDLSKEIRAHKPGDKVTVGFIRDGKDQKVTAELGKYKGVNMRTYAPGQNYYKMEIPELNFDQMPRGQAIPRIQGQNWSWSGGGPKLGMFVQDTEDGKGVKVIDVDEDGNASKAGIKEEDVITEVEGKAVNSADEVAKVVKESKDKVSINVKLLRKGKAENVQVKIPRRLKTADL